MKRLPSIGLLIVVLALAVASADGGAETEADGRLRPLITTAELVIGQNRFAFGLLKANRFLEGVHVVVRLYTIGGNEAQLTAETNAPYRPVEIIEPRQQVHRHADGTRHLHRANTGVRGLYVTKVTFARPGPWAIEIIAGEGNGFDTARVKVTVLDSPPTPMLGSPAPRSQNLVASDVRDLRQIDTSERPDRRLHRVRIADAITQGKPQVIVFATPQFCTSQMCGPMLEIVRRLLPVYANRVVFTHQEIWQDFAGKKLFPTVTEWRLQSEPWIFLVDAQGIIRAKFEGLPTVHELEMALEQMLMRGTPRRQ